MSDENEISEEELQAALEEVVAQAMPIEVWGPETIAYYGPTTRSILLTGEVNSDLANAVCSQLKHLSAIDSEDIITLVINSPGGDVLQALAIYDTVRSIENPVVTMVQGVAASAGLLLLQAGDFRVALPNSKLFYHQPISETAVTSAHSMDEFHDEYLWAKDMIDGIIRTRGRITKRNWVKYFEKKPESSWFTADLAEEIRLIDKVIDYAVKPKINFE
jgi:ATP-dependent Clp protease protease subunit